MNKIITLGSIFDGSGGFPLGAILAGIEPIWASEIEPFPIRVTEKRIPKMKHCGDVRKLNGAELTPVDIITFGSPCQDMSIAGKRNGLDGSRSSLFYEAVRIINEMRCATNGKYPRFAVWENVCGAFSSNGGEDFRKVLETLCRVKDSEVCVPEFEKWTKSGKIMGDNFSIAWRTFDAQYWGVPQRRKRIYLVADFDDEYAPKILFESEGLSGYSAESFRTWQRTAENTENCTGTSGNRDMTSCKDVVSVLLENHPSDSRVKATDVCQTLTQSMGGGGGNAPFVVYGVCSKQSHSMLSGNAHSGFYEAETSRAIDTSSQSPCRNQGGMAVVEGFSYGIGKSALNQGKNAKFSFQIDTELSPSLLASGTGGVAYSSSKSSFFTSTEREKASSLVATDYKEPPIVTDYTVRRLTPKECARLQGFPSWWCENLGTENPSKHEIDRWVKIFDNRKSEKQVEKWLKSPHSDSAEYKMWGNGVALPCVYFVLSGIVTYTQ